MPVNLSVLLTAEIWEHQRRFSTGTITVHDLNATRIRTISDDFYGRVLGDVTTTDPDGYVNDTPISLLSIVATV